MYDLDHEQVLVSTGRRSRLPVIIAVHSTTLGQAVGGCRMWRYGDWTAGLDDALRLSTAMTLKCSLAGLKLGGGKSVIALPDGFVLDDERRRAVLLDLGDAIDSLGGVYGVGEDVGTTADDMATISERTTHVYGLPEATGGTGEPSGPTALGVHECIRVTCEEVYGSPDVAGRRIVIVGLGQVGSRLADRLNADGAKLTVTDIDPAKRDIATRIGADWVAAEDAMSVEADILVPAALGGLLTMQTALTVRCAAIVGPANNQLAEDDVALVLARRGVLWAPDFLVNAGGVVYGAHMELGSRSVDKAMAAVSAIGSTFRDVYARAARDGATPLDAALALAKDRVATEAQRARRRA